jgi:hypothetical protein
MILNKPVELKANKLQRTSATTDHDLQMCFKRVAFGTSEVYREASRIGNAFSRLGNTAHKLIEEATKGDFDQFDQQTRRTAIEERWNAIVEKEYADFQERALVPVDIPLKWRGYAIKKLQSVTLALDIAEGNADTSTGMSGQAFLASKGIQLESEKSLSAFNERLFGKIDLLRTTDQGLELVDYKSGPLYETQDDKTVNPRVKERYSQQMLIYAGLAYEALGQWPVKLILHSLIDGECEIPVDIDMIKALCSDTISRFDSYNAQVDSGDIVGTPSKENCKVCDFKPVCLDFLGLADPSWGGFARTVYGEISSVESPLPSLISLDVKGGDYDLGPTTIRGLPSSVTSAILGKLGSTISVKGLLSRVGTNDLSCSDGTQVWLWE